MSADNGIYIGSFPVSEGSEIKEYRTIHAQAIDNVSWNPNQDSDEGDYENPREIVEYFGAAYPFSVQSVAQAKAFLMEKEIMDGDLPILEYGISSMTFEHSMQYYRDHAHEVVYKWDEREKTDGQH